jgi:photosystem II stability/assembly factor-like uncharacterized protein
VFAFSGVSEGEWHLGEDLAINPVNSRTLLVALGYKGGVYKSHDRGPSWYSANTGIGLEGGQYVFSAAIDPADTDIVYAAGTEVYVSYDAGATWQEMGEGLPAHLAW